MDINLSIDYKPNNKQMAAHIAATTHRNVLYGGAVGGGKVVADKGLILTPFGFKLGEDLRVGDLINNPDGTVQRIIQIKPRVHLPLWRVNFSDGTSTDVAQDHLWLSWKGEKGRKINNKRTFGEASAEVVETQELKQWLDCGYTPQIPVCEEQPFNVTSKEVNPIDPYLLGVLLGDGHLDSVSISCHEDDKKEYRKIFGEEGFSYVTTSNIRLVGGHRKHILKKLSDYGLSGKLSHTKFIPKSFKLGSIQTRYEIIRGLMDTDGYSSPEKNGCYYYTTSKKLSDDVCFILRSLGAVVTVWESIGSYKDDAGNKHLCKKVYNHYIKHRTPDKLFSLKRKQYGFKRKISKAVKNIEIDGYITGRCITVSNPNGLYITNDFIVTHNSYWLCISAIHHAIRYPGSRVCLVRKHLSTFKNSTLVTLMGLIPDELKNPALGWSHNQQDGKIILPNKSVIVYGGVGTPEEVQKIGSTEFSLIGIDEAGEVDLEPFLFLSSRLRWTLPDGSTPHYNILLASNPAHNWLKEYFIDNPRENFIFIQALPKDNLENLPDDYIDNLRKIYPKEWVEKFLEGDWNSLSGENVVIPYDLIKAAVNRDIPLIDKPIIGVDPAGTGGDETAIVFAKGNTIIDINCNRQADPMISCGRISRLWHKKNCISGMIETDGMGEVFLSRLREMGLKLRGFKSGSKSSKPDQYYNLKTEAWFYARELFEEGLVSIPDDTRLINQLAACKYEVRDSGGKLKIESKKDMKQKMGGSPDRADAVIVTLWCNKFQRDPKRDFTRKILKKVGRNNSYGWNIHNS